MCATCGCGTDSVQYVKPDVNQLQLADHTTHRHDYVQKQKTIIDVERDIMEKNNSFAARLKEYFDEKKIFVVNLVSAPGSGKTTLLEKNLLANDGYIRFSVIEGDQQTTHDAERIKKTNNPVVQINTGKCCHLDAEMVYNSLRYLQPPEHSILFIENVGNLVCPALFDLGEKERVVIMSVTEGEDKPLKYPEMFHTSTLCIINKTDLLPYVPFNIEKAKAYARQVNHNLEIIEVSCLTGEGLPQWYEWLRAKVPVLQPA